MIAIRAGRPVWSVLVAVVDNPGELRVEDLDAIVNPRPRLAGTAYLAWRVLMRSWEAAATDRRAAVSRLVGRLQEARLVAPVSAPRLAPWFLHEVSRHGIGVALERSHPRWPSSIPSMPGHARLVRRVALLPGSTRALLGSRPSGAMTRCYADLVGWGVIVSPAQRWPTKLGIERVRAWRVAA